MKTSSAKAKGRVLQQWVMDQISEADSELETIVEKGRIDESENKGSK